MRSSYSHRLVAALAGVLCTGSLVTCKVKRHTETYSIGSDCGPKDQSCIDARTARLCDGDELATFECRGPEGCRDDGGDPKHVYCDRAKARVGDRCLAPRDEEELHTCSEDGRAELACVDGAWRKVKDCRRCFYEKRDTAIPHLPTFTLECE